MKTMSHQRRSLGAACLAVLFGVSATAGRAHAHFQELIPSLDIVSEETAKTVAFAITFTHPMEQGPAMAMAEPVSFGVLVGGKRTDLKGALKAVEVDNARAYTASAPIRTPGDHIFFIEPAPYWEPAEGKYITHFTKVVVDGFGAEDAWDARVGFPVEIVPLVRPYGLWTGNVFRGVVMRGDAPVPFATVEVEYRNEKKAVAIPAAPFVTQTVKADAAGTFTYAMPRAGWWGFAALIDGEERKAPDGSAAGHELGALMWVRTQDMK